MATSFGKSGHSDTDTTLGGIRVLDLATFVAAPFCATLMSEFGAEVIKVEMPVQGDPCRQLGEKYNGVSLIWAQENRNKEGITCDLRRPEGQAIIKELGACPIFPGKMASDGVANKGVTG